MIRPCLLAAVLPALAAAPLSAQNAAPTFDPTQAWAQMQMQLVQQFDANKDGKLTGQEQILAQEYMRKQGINMGLAPGGLPGADQFNKQFDRNRDGKLDLAERAAAQAAYQRMRSGRSGGVQSGSLPGSGVAPPTVDPTAKADQKPAKVPPLIKRFDKDGDGKLNDAEKAAAQAELKKTKFKDKDAAADKVGADKVGAGKDEKPGKD